MGSTTRCIQDSLTPSPYPIQRRSSNGPNTSSGTTKSVLETGDNATHPSSASHHGHASTKSTKVPRVHHCRSTSTEIAQICRTAINKSTQTCRNTHHHGDTASSCTQRRTNTIESQKRVQSWTMAVLCTIGSEHVGTTKTTTTQNSTPRTTAETAETTTTAGIAIIAQIIIAAIVVVVVGIAIVVDVWRKDVDDRLDIADGEKVSIRGDRDGRDGDLGWQTVRS
ncbi:MAG: hypothetical protein JOS17DRAFT_473613 [Linnemannia elongata]|nr:MAG: hypothetical protein JOS17DRAFT_473613 [Linnemannia elongata]